MKKSRKYHPGRWQRRIRETLHRETVFDARDQLWSFVGTMAGLGLVALIQSFYLSDHDNQLLIGSFGALSVLIFAATHSPLVQPRNVFGGQIISALIGVTVYQVLPDVLWLTAPLAVAASITAMQITRTLHPPGGATALIAVIGTDSIKGLGYFYVLSPVLSGTLIIFIVALISNNMTPSKQYPTGRSRLIEMFRFSRSRRR